MVAPLIPLAVGAVARVAGSRMAAGAVAKQAAGTATGGGGLAAGRALQFGGTALQVTGQRKSQPHQQAAPPAGTSRFQHTKDWAKQNPGEATFAAVAAFRGSSLADGAEQDFNSIMQQGQFKTTPQTP